MATSVGATLSPVPAAAQPAPAGVEPVPAGVQRPLWSVMIPTYNCARFLATTLRSVLAQDSGPAVMQIQVVDDCSTEDDPAEIVRALGGGRVEFHRHERNIGQVANLNACLARSRGRVVHLLHGDDAVREGFYATMARAFEAAPHIGAAFCRYIVMDDEGRWTHIAKMETNRSGVIPDWLARIGTGQRLQTPGMVVRRAVYEQLGGFDQRLLYCEDWEMWVRVAAHFPVWYEVEPLAIYRVHRSSVSGRSVRSGENGAYLRRAVEINRQHLPRELADDISQRALRNNAQACVRRAFRFANAGELAAARAQLREAVRFSRSPAVLATTAGVAAYAVLRSMRRGQQTDAAS